MRYGTATAFGMLLCVVGASRADAGKLLELTTDGTAYQGQVWAHDSRTCWLLARDGQLHEVATSEVRSFRELGRPFQPMSSVELREELRRELGPGFEIAGTGQYLVAAQHGRARAFADMFDGLYRTFHSSFTARGLTLSRPQFPLVAIVFPDRGGFTDYCRREGVPAGPGLMGYYLPLSNRVALFDSGTKKLSKLPAEQALTSLRFHASVQGDLADTIIHEATHQVAFNTGLHPRLGDCPRWVVEGLATVFEAPGIRDGGAGVALKAKLNRERFVWFGSYAKARRPARGLEAFLSSDQPFASAALDAYSEAWALSFYLLETQPGRYASYLKRLAARDPLAAYPPAARLADFRAEFGADLAQFEADFLRFMARLN